MWPSNQAVKIIRSIAEASEVTRPWRTVNISKSSSKGSSRGTGGGMKIRAWCYIRARSHAYAERRFLREACGQGETEVSPP